jgi:hypothetical protein
MCLIKPHDNNGQFFVIFLKDLAPFRQQYLKRTQTPQQNPNTSNLNRTQTQAKPQTNPNTRKPQKKSNTSETSIEPKHKQNLNRTKHTSKTSKEPRHKHNLIFFWRYLPRDKSHRHEVNREMAANIFLYHETEFCKGTKMSFKDLQQIFYLRLMCRT